MDRPVRDESRGGLHSPFLIPPDEGDPEPDPPASTAAFVETFDGNSGLDRFDIGLWHRDDTLTGDSSWQAAHDESCGPPTTSRTVTRDDWTSSFYVCRDHLMTAVGDTSGYSIGYFRPKATFNRAETQTVSWDVNVGGGHLVRQWWEVLIQPAGSTAHDAPQRSRDGTACDGACTTVSWLAQVFGLQGYTADDVVVGIGPFGQEPTFNGGDLTWQSVCGGGFPMFPPETCASEAIRLPFSITDNLDGTLTINFGGQTFTKNGQFPDEFEVVFKDHNYTPDKDGTPASYTWHWDNIIVQ